MFAGSLTPWLLIAWFISAVVVGGTGYIKGKNDAQAEQASQELLIAKAAQEAQQATAEVIAQIKVTNKVINKEIQRETRTVPVYSDCRNSESGMQLINNALTGTKPASDVKLPRITGDTTR